MERLPTDSQPSLLPHQAENQEPKFRDVFSQPSWVIGNDVVELAVTQRGAHMAPVTFYRNQENSVQPYYISPSQQEKHPQEDSPEVMRGDFFCLPFGGNTTPYNGENHPSHGETARSRWSLIGLRTHGRLTTLTLAIETKIRPGRVTRQLSLIQGHNVVYDRTEIVGFAGKTTMAHHALLRMPNKDEALLVSTSHFVLGLTCPYPFSDPAKGEYQSLEVGATFADLSQVPSIYKNSPDADCSAFPSRRGYCDLLETFSDPTAEDPAWVTAVNTEESYLWFALKDPKVLPGRIFWMENHGRHGAPWNGNINCLGLEDGCMFFEKGIPESYLPNQANVLSIPTCRLLSGDTPFAVNYIQGAVRVPEGFGRVRMAEFLPDGVSFISEDGQEAFTSVNHQFLYGSPLEGNAP